MPLWLKLLSIVPMWAGLDLMAGKLFGMPRGILHLSDLLWDGLVALTGSVTDATLAVGLLTVVSLVTVIVNLSLPAKT
jgi:hypothetical protein